MTPYIKDYDADSANSPRRVQWLRTHGGAVRAHDPDLRACRGQSEWVESPERTQWLLTLRKQNAAVVLASQSPSQLAQLPNRHTVVDSCPTRICLPNPDATTPAQAPLYRDLGLNDREIGIIAGATAKRHYYLKSPRGSRLF